MRFNGLFIRAAAAFAAFAACTGGAPVTASAVASTPSLAWEGVDSVHLLCLVSPDTTPGRLQLQAEICETVRKLAADGAPVPVAVVGFGDPAVLERGSASLLVHASIQGQGGDRLLVFHIRAYRPNRAESEMLFGPAPRAVPFTGSGSAAVQTALREALAEILPWRQAR